MKAVFGFFLVSLFAITNAQAEVQVFKMLDGSARTCDQNVERATNALGNKMVSITMERDLSRESRQTEPVLKVSVVKCEGSDMVVDNSPAIENYTIKGVDVEVRYSNFELLLTDENLNVLLETKLDYIGQDSTEEKSFSVSSERAATGLQLFIRAKKTVKTSEGYEFSETVAFGAFRLRLKQ